jgi:glyoxylase-like metal-dependent hydrolase (beta-lactamase superfamily II)
MLEKPGMRTTESGAGMAITWSVHPIDLARRTAHRSWFFYLNEEAGPLEIAYRAWALRSQEECILVDTGPPPDEAARRGLRQIRPIGHALLDIGVHVQDVRDVVLTHLHWDHASSADQFANATFHVQRKEVDFFLGQAHEHPATGRFFSHREMLARLLESGRVHVCDGDYELRSGLRLMHVGGHTPGSQIVVIERAEGRAVIASDAIPLNRNYTDLIPNGILVNVVDAVAALKTVRSLGATEIYTGHDIVPSLVIPQS